MRWVWHLRVLSLLAVIATLVYLWQLRDDIRFIVSSPPAGPGIVAELREASDVIRFIRDHPESISAVVIDGVDISCRSCQQPRLSAGLQKIAIAASALWHYDTLGLAADSALIRMVRDNDKVAMDRFVKMGHDQTYRSRIGLTGSELPVSNTVITQDQTASESDLGSISAAMQRLRAEAPNRLTKMVPMEIARLLAGIIVDTLGTPAFREGMRGLLETASVTARGNQSGISITTGAFPGVISVAGYLRVPEESTFRVVVLMLENLSIETYLSCLRSDVINTFSLQLLAQPNLIILDSSQTHAFN